MRSVFTDGFNFLVYESEDGFLPFDDKDLYELIGLAFHYAQQTRGNIELNGIQIFPTSLLQTIGAAVAPCDYVRVGYGRTENFMLLSDIAQTVTASEREIEVSVIRA